MEIFQYVCVSIDESQSPALSTMYIQIILRRVINKHGWFLDQVTGTHEKKAFNFAFVFFGETLSILIGDRCNYHVTDNDLAWNEYIKKGTDPLTINICNSVY